MKIKKVLALAGCVLLLSTVFAGAQSVVPPLSFFAENGELNSHIIVGSNAAAQDVVCATQIAAFLGTLLYEVSETTIESELFISEHEDIPQGITVYDDPSTLESLWYQDTLPWGDFDGNFDPWETHEEIRVTPFDISELTNGFLLPDGILELVGREQSTGLPSVLYAVDNVRICPRIWVTSSKPIFGYSYCVDLDWFGVLTYPLPDPQINPPSFMLLGELYHVIDAGYFRDFIIERQEDNPDYTVPVAYVLTGESLYFFEQYIEVGEERQYKGLTLKLIDVDADHNKAFIEIEDVNMGSLFKGYMVLGPEHGFSPKLQEMAPPFAPYNAIAVGRSQHDVATISNTVYYFDDQGLTHFQYSYVVFAVDGVAVFTGAAGKHYGLQYNAYVLDNYFLFQDRYCCVPFSDQIYPWSLQIYFSTTKNPETDYDTNNYHETWPTELQDLELGDWLGPYLYTLNATDFQFEMVMGLCETVQIPDCEEEYVFTGPENYYLGTVEFTLRRPYFSVHFTDITTDSGFDFNVSQEIIGQTITIRNTASIDTSLIVFTDREYYWEEWKVQSEYNLILVGGPVANIIVKKLQDDDLTYVDWVNSLGEWEWLISPYGSSDILIVAGADRLATTEATKELLELVRASA